MNKLSLFCFILFILGSCNKPVESEDPAKFDEKGNLIVYSEEVYAKMWFKNRNLKVTVIDTFCINQKSRVLKDIQKGKLVYFGFHPREFKKMSEILLKYGIESKEHLGRCVRIGGFEPFCYEEEMYKEINRKYGNHFIDSIFRMVQKEYILEHPDVPYFEDGVDLREKYKSDLKKKK
ncbi:hypothetical protein NAT51_05430 [Flavobacterium amniphilum]|uniref:hypothetical protein n=1 Tax=Flavobacterium amniphilum TaxID=1834035 RepID=UPI00202A9C5D|nr:hypothetical protein [Flavobacterium amniphilum]MCL9804948.1 hypothetical protein [Flavobacterium amniphilum]